MTNKYAVEIQELSMNYGSTKALDNMSLSLEPDKIYGLLGRNGAGKTTTIRTVLGIIARDSGEVFIGDKPFPPYYHDVGYLPEERGLYPKVKVDEQLIYFASLRGMKKSDAKKALSYWLERLEMGQYEKKNFETLSKGNQQKIQLIVALLHNPQIVILDEPFSGLDPVNALMLKSVVLELISNGKTVIFSSHQMNFVEEFCSDVLLLHGSHIVLQGSLNKIKRSYERKSLFIRLREPGLDISGDLKIPGVVKAEPLNEGFMLTLESEDISKPVFGALAEKQLDIDRFELIEHSLNDIFIMKAGENL